MKITDNEIRSHWLSYLDKRGIERPKSNKLKDLAKIVHKSLYGEEYNFNTSKYVRSFLTDRMKERRSHKKVVEAKIPKKIVYFIGNEEFGRVKIGKTTNLFSRLSTLQVGSPFTLKVLGFIGDDNHHVKEKEVHKKFAEYHIHGEWYELNEKIYDYINKYCSKLGSVF